MGAEIKWDSSSEGVVIPPTVCANSERGESPIPSTCRFYPGGAPKAVTQFDGTESKSHPSSASAPRACWVGLLLQ